MVDPAKVLGFLDIFGNWDPSLAFVMGGAVAVSALGYRLRAGGAACPSSHRRLEIPTRRDLDPRLIGGAALFGIGWGLVGLCPGPALTALTFGPWQVFVFVAAMIAGMALFRLVPASTGRRQPSGASPQARPTTPDLLAGALATGSRGTVTRIKPSSHRTRCREPPFAGPGWSILPSPMARQRIATVRPGAEGLGCSGDPVLRREPWLQASSLRRT